MTSWRSGRRGEGFSTEGAFRSGRRVPKTERAEDAGTGWGLTSPDPTDQDRFGSPNSNKSAREARGHHTQAPEAERPFAVGSESVRFFGITRGRKTLRPDAQASTDAQASLVESLILAQDQRWRRA